ncbi:hypothetical protein Sgleb_73270 [Streptomyces glebosus]|uniref:Uncharacterized protein n=1 Tax=Streptomyces glebosus TaxID=249580 RepID=A0A640T7W3_9ACTN|nr:hypothetical protein Sgleb_73270 [Streptomyces glebosus]GHG79098.1 hypothetical protein GCM10010513_56160 [Streptomyces glebosus]
MVDQADAELETGLAGSDDGDLAHEGVLRGLGCAFLSGAVQCRALCSVSARGGVNRRAVVVWNAAARRRGAGGQPREAGAPVGPGDGPPGNPAG